MRWLLSHRQAGAGWTVRGLELPRQNWSKTKGERLWAGPGGASSQRLPSEALSSLLSAPPKLGSQLLRLHSQHPRSQFVYLWFNEHQMLRPGTWRPRKFQFQAYSL